MTERYRPLQLAEHIGSTLGSSSWITIDQPRIDQFAHCTLDDQWIHVDTERAAKESPFGGTVAHGYLTLALLAPTTMEVMTQRVAMSSGLNYGLDKVRFLAPVRAGKRVRNHLRLLAVDDKGGGRVLATIENTIEIEGEDKPALIATTLAMLME
ncbi:MAG: MaoC family dehydratase [Burkholderiaceae bacterium]|nr:MaoC family dehydratase [Burkholderiaceae bacterium]